MSEETEQEARASMSRVGEKHGKEIVEALLFLMKHIATGLGIVSCTYVLLLLLKWLLW